MKKYLRGLASVVMLCSTCVSGLFGQHLPSSSPKDDIANIISLVSRTAITETIQGLESFGNRSWSNPNRDSVASWILQRFQGAGIADVAIDSFQYSSTWQTNIIATIPGSISPTKEIIVGGHYDCVSASPGADDNGSGTAAVIEMARVLRAVNYVPRATLRFMAFAAEEAGLRGSAHVASEAKTANRNVVLMQNYDMIGYRDTTQPARQVYVVWYPGSEQEARLDSTLKVAYTTLTPMLTTSYRGGSDSYSFYLQGFKSVFNIERNFSPVYHTLRDSLRLLDIAFAADIIKSGLALLLTTDAAVTSAEGLAAGVPAEFALDQNYPNPFNGYSNIGYRVAAHSHVSLQVYDMLGRQVATLADDDKPAGVYSVRFDGSNLGSGVYFYRLKAGSFVETKRLLLLK